MGLTHQSTGIHAADLGPCVFKKTPTDKVIALAGNPNVGKSTIFNALTGMNQHTGNWPGKTVTNATGYCTTKQGRCVLVDIPGTYSLFAHSAEEEVARNFICFGKPDAVVVVCDATCLERNLNLVLQTMEITSRVVVCLNLMDEAQKKQIRIDTAHLSRQLGVPVVGTNARNKKSLQALMAAVEQVTTQQPKYPSIPVTYPPCMEQALQMMQPQAAALGGDALPSRWLSLMLLDPDAALMEQVTHFLGQNPLDDRAVADAQRDAKAVLYADGIRTADQLKDQIVASLTHRAFDLCQQAVVLPEQSYFGRDRRLDALLTSKFTGYPVMLALLAVVFWLTITGANYPSQLLSNGLFRIQEMLTMLFTRLHAPDWLHGMLVLGAYRVLAWVVSVMLPPMAIFFPLFTLLEDAGYLPRIAYNLDKPFQKCCSCGKQALCMCMGFGCNAAGIIGCRIIDSPRERLLAILTNNFVPCNGRFPMLITLVTVFFIGSRAGLGSSVTCALLLTGGIALSVCITLFVTRLLSRTLLKGVPSSFTLELPPYRAPQIGRVLVRSVFDRTLFVLGRAAAVAAPAGVVIWIMANVTIGNVSLLRIFSEFLDPVAGIMGMDGVILMAFILGFPANEIVIPIAIMAYTAQGSLISMDSPAMLRTLLVSNGWTWVTAVNVMLFSMNHWPCSTTLLTIKKETGSLKWTLLAAALPTAVGVVICTVFTAVVRLALGG